MVSKLSLSLGLAGSVPAAIAAYDVYKMMKLHSGEDGLDRDKLVSLINKDPVYAEKYIRERNAKVNVIADEGRVESFIDEQDETLNSLQKNILKNHFNSAIKNKNNAFAHAGRDGRPDSIITPPIMGKTTIDHELGHIKDFERIREKGSTLSEEYNLPDKENSRLLRSITRILLKDVYNKDKMRIEDNAWKHVEDSPEKEEMMNHSKKDYEKNFHQGRSIIAGSLGGGILGSALGSFSKNPLVRIGSGYAGSIAGALPGSMIGSFSKHPLARIGAEHAGSIIGALPGVMS